MYGGGGNRSKLRRYDMGEVTGEMADLCVLTCDNPRDEEIRDINNDIKVGLAKSNGKYIEIDEQKRGNRLLHGKCPAGRYDRTARKRA